MAEEMLYDSDAMRQFAGIELDDRIPDETTILNFRHLLEKHQLTEKLFVEVYRHLTVHGITLCSGTLVDATIIDAPSSTKNEAKARDPEMSSTKKGNDWYLGMKAHVGVDAQSGIVHSLDTTTPRHTTAKSGTRSCMATRHPFGLTRAMSALCGRPRFPAPTSSGPSCAKRQRAARSTPSTKTSTGSSPRCGPGSSIRSGC